MICHVGLGDHENARRCAEQSRQLVKPDSDVLDQVRLRNPLWAKDVADALQVADGHPD